MEASLDALPRFEGSFDKVFGVNALQFADQPIDVLRAVRDRMNAGGRIAITQQSRKPDATDGDSIQAAERVGELLAKVGFASVRIETLAFKRCAACVRALAN